MRVEKKSVLVTYMFALSKFRLPLLVLSWGNSPCSVLVNFENCIIFTTQNGGFGWWEIWILSHNLIFLKARLWGSEGDSTFAVSLVLNGSLPEQVRSIKSGSGPLFCRFASLCTRVLNSIVTCSSGIGRTGTLLAVCQYLRLYQNGNAPDVCAIVRELRRHRMGMVQTREQYEFIYRILEDFGINLQSCPSRSVTIASYVNEMSSPSSSPLSSNSSKSLSEKVRSSSSLPNLSGHSDLALPVGRIQPVL